MASDDTPLVIERGDVLPARDKHRIVIISVMRVERPAGQLTSTVQQQHARARTVRLFQAKSVGLP